MLDFITDLTFMRTFLQYLINDFVLGDQIREVNRYGNKKHMVKPQVIGTNLVSCALTPAALVLSGAFLALKWGGTAAVLVFCNAPIVATTVTLGSAG